MKKILLAFFGFLMAAFNICMAREITVHISDVADKTWSECKLDVETSRGRKIIGSSHTNLSSSTYSKMARVIPTINCLVKVTGYDEFGPANIATLPEFDAKDPISFAEGKRLVHSFVEQLKSVGICPNGVDDEIECKLSDKD